MSVRKSLAWILSAQAVSGALLFAGSVAMARLLSPREMGIYAFGFAASGAVTLFGTLGIGAFLVREPDLPPAKVDTACTLNAFANLAVALVILVLSYPIAAFMREPAIGAVLRILAVRPLFSLVEFRPMFLSQRELNFRTIALIGAGAAIANVLLMIGLALLGYSYLSMAIATVAGGAVSAAAFVLLVPEHARFRWSLSGWRPIASFGLRILSVSGMALLGYRLGEMIVGRLLGIPALGLLTRATQIWDLVYFNVYGSAARVMFAKLSEDYRQTSSLSGPYQRALMTITALMWPMALGIAVLAGPIIYRLYGARWLDAAPALSILMLGLVIASAFSLNWEVFVIKDRTALQTRFEAARATSGVAAASIGCLAGVWGAAFGRVAECAVGFVLYMPQLARLTGLRFAQLTGIYGIAALLAVGAAFPAALLMALSRWQADTSLISIGVAVAAGICIWIALLFVTRHPLREEFRAYRLALAARGANVP